MTFRGRLRQAARAAKACPYHGSVSVSPGLRNRPWVWGDNDTLPTCDACADSLVAAVLDEFVKDPAIAIKAADDYRGEDEVYYTSSDETFANLTDMIEVAFAAQRKAAV